MSLQGAFAFAEQIPSVLHTPSTEFFSHEPWIPGSDFLEEPGSQKGRLTVLVSGYLSWCFAWIHLGAILLHTAEPPPSPVANPPISTFSTRTCSYTMFISITALRSPPKNHPPQKNRPTDARLLRLGSTLRLVLGPGLRVGRSAHPTRMTRRRTWVGLKPPRRTIRSFGKGRNAVVRPPSSAKHVIRRKEGSENVGSVWRCRLLLASQEGCLQTCQQTWTMDIHLEETKSWEPVNAVSFWFRWYVLTRHGNVLRFSSNIKTKAPPGRLVQSRQCFLC